MKRLVYLFTLLQLLNGTLSFNNNLRLSNSNGNNQVIPKNLPFVQNKISLDNDIVYDELDHTEEIKRDRTIFDLNKPSSNLITLPKNLENDVSDFKCTPSVCLNEGICTSTGSSFQCKCPWGWTGSRCEICLTECASNPCSSNKRCKAKYGGGYECVCPADRVGLDCEIQNDLCATNPCLNDGVCKPIEGGSFTCICDKPWSGENCEKIWENPCTEDALRSNEMLQFKDPWDRNSYLICTDISIYHNMPCSVGTYFNEKLRHCVPEGYDPPSCPDQHCKNDADCIIDEGNNLRCVCKKGFKGELCEENIDECISQGGHEACDGGKCVDQTNGFYCSCPNGIGLDCKQTISNPCTSDNFANGMQFFELKGLKHNVFLQCIGDSTFVVSRCADNLFWNPEERTCTIEKPVLKTGSCLSFPCKNGGDCQESSDSAFKCICKNGYTGQVCEEMIDFCISNPCINGGRCLSFAGGYTCVCPDKIVDECCCHGLLNPCPSKSKLIPGVNNYFPHLFPNRYLHCDFDGRAFARSCAPGLKWKQEALSCLPNNFGVEATNGFIEAANKTNKIIKINENTVERKPTVVPKMMQPLTLNQNQVPMKPLQRESNNNQAYNQQKNDLQRGVMRSFEHDQVEDHEKQMQQIQQQQQQVQQQQQLQQQQLELQQQRDKLQQEQDQKQREQEQIRQQQQLEEQRRVIQQQQEKVLEQQQKVQQQQQLQQQEDQKHQEELKKHLEHLNQQQILPQSSLDDEDQVIVRTKQGRDQRQREQDERQQQMQLQIQQQQQEQQRMQIEQQQKQIQQQFQFQKQQTLQEQQEQQRQQNIQTQFQQQLKQVPVFRSTGGKILEEDQLSSKLKVDRDQRQREQDERQQQMQLQIQQQQQEQQRMQIEQQQKQIQQQFQFQKQQTLQEQQEQQRQQNIQTQFQQQLKQAPIPMLSQQLEFDQQIPLSNLNKGFTAGSVLPSKETPKVTFSKSSNLYFKPTFSSNRKQPIFSKSQ